MANVNGSASSSAAQPPSNLPRRTSLSRISGLKGFLPLTPESSAFSTRGQVLPNLLARRPSTLRSSERQGSFGSDGDVEHQALRQSLVAWGAGPDAERRLSIGAAALNAPQMRSARLIGNSNPRYKWSKYYKTDAELKQMTKPIRRYYERNNDLIQHYIYIDRVLDSSLPHNLIQEYSTLESGRIEIPSTIAEESPPPISTPGNTSGSNHQSQDRTKVNHRQQDTADAKSSGSRAHHKVKRTPKDLYRVPEADEQSPLLHDDSTDDEEEGGSTRKQLRDWAPEEEEDTDSSIVKFALYVNVAANTVLLILKIIVAVLTSSLSVIASLVDAALDFLSTAIVWFTSWMIARQDQYKYPVGRRRLEPIGVLVFSVIMITSFFQVALEGLSRLRGDDHSVVQLTVPAIAIMASTVLIKGLCWLWCRFIKNSSVQALAQDAQTDVIFNTFSIIFPLLGFYLRIWWLDALGGVLLSLFVIINWSTTSSLHIRNLTGAAATADERNILLYLTMRFARTIKQIQGLQAYHAGDKLNVEVDIVVDEEMGLRDSHDLGESLQYVLESVPYVDRAFVHIDYMGWNLPTHMQQQA